MKKYLQFSLFLLHLLWIRPTHSQTIEDWQLLVLPPESPNAVMEVCNQLVSQTPSGFFWKEKDSLNWLPVNTLILPNNGIGLPLISNKRGFLVYQKLTTYQDALSHYWTDTYWSYDCENHEFDLELTFQSNNLKREQHGK